MSLSADAIQYIEKLIYTANGSDVVTEQSNGSAIPLPPDVRITDLEKYLPNRRRFRGSMSTHLIEQFGEYTNKVSAACQSKIPCFIDANAMSACTFFNLGTVEEPGHGDHQATIALRTTDPFNELKSVHGDTLNQRALAEWMEDWLDYLSATDNDRKELTMTQAIAAIRRLTISAKAEATSEEQTFGSRKSAMSEVEAKNKDTLPAFLHFHTEPFHGLSARSFTVRISLLTGGDAPRFTLRIVRLESAMEEVAEEFREKLEAALNKESVETFVGSFSP